MKSRVLIVEDELLIANYIRDVLEREGYPVVGIGRDYEQAMALFKQNQPHLVCMDIGLKGGSDGIALAEEFRQIGSFSLIYLTAYGDRTHVQKAQKTGPFGFLVKPVSDQTILATVATALVNDPQLQSEPESAADLFEVSCAEKRAVIDCHGGFIRCSGATVQLTPKESQLLAILLNTSGELVPFRKVKAAVWSDCSVSDTSLKTLVWRLRSKLPDRDLLKTVSGFGYTMACEVKRLSRS